MRTLVNLLALTVLLVLATTFVGWWSVPVVAGLWTLVFPARGAVLYAAAAGALSWGTLLLWSSRGGPTLDVGSILGAIMDVPPSSLVALTVAYAALLAGAAALLAQSLRPLRRPGERERIST